MLNWVGFIFVGGDIVLMNKEVLMSSVIFKLLDNFVNCRDVLKVFVYLVCEILLIFLIKVIYCFFWRFCVDELGILMINSLVLFVYRWF